MGLFDDIKSVFENCYWGLDFGTYRSMLSYISEGEPPKVPAYKDACLGGVPSLFWRDAGGSEYVGDEVQTKDGLSVDPAGVCSSVKTKLSEKEILLHGKSYTPCEIAIRIVKRVLEVSKPLLAQEFIDMDIESLVVGVPVRFTAAERGEISHIVETALAGKHVRLVPEPILAALCIDYFMRRTGNQTNRPVLVYDMGAGTFDAVVLQPNSKRTVGNPFPYEAINPQGINIAGDRMDKLMEELIMEKLRQNPGKLNLSVLEDTAHQDRIKLSTYFARMAKERLSEADAIDIQITGVDCGVGMLHITREEYEEKIRPDIRKTVNLAAEVVRGAGLWGAPALDILLVGGSTYIPLIKEMLLKEFNWLAESHIQQRFPEKAVALGAALYAAEPEVVMPKVAFGYAVNTFHTQQGRPMLHVRIPSNADLPMTVKADYYTRFDNQREVLFQIYEIDHGEQDQFLEMEEGTLLSEKGRAYQITHDFNRMVPAGTRVELTTTLNRDGLLTMAVDDLGINTTTVQTFSLTGTSSTSA